MNKALTASSHLQFTGFGLVLLISLFAGIYTENYLWFGAPLGIAAAYIGITNIRILYYCLLFFLPLSIEVELPGGFGTDFPDELITVGLMCLTIAYIITNRNAPLEPIYRNPLALLLLIHFVWILFTVVTSSLLVVSIKYTLAKTWYLITFVVLTVMIIRKLEDFKLAFWIITLPLLFTVVYTLFRHYQEDFTFVSVNKTMVPFFRNHVNYSAMISEWIPFVWLAIGWYARRMLQRKFLWMILFVFVAGLIFAYTRSGWIAVIASVAMALVVHLKLTRWVIGFGIVASIVAIFYLAAQYRFMNYAPKYERTIYHERLGEHLESTYKLEDISSAERVYRWIAGFKMWEANPLVGYGPGNFYNFYKGYTVTAFRTYVSRNPEKSTVHNYFILLLVEQGIIGLVIFLILTAAIFIYGEKLYHRITDEQDKRWALAILMSLAAIYVNNSLSDMIETDKVGSIYFINIAMLIVLMYKYPPLKKTGS